ncbi:prolyl oligopeptidase [Haloactinospora alba]|uniref:prolyl oligopeptidase n=1 Tax=Haloactinospora alba TaxID=405555 RepID=A0A543NJ39_9ACTN|nr:prolyl oligopeptidase family serine peptidase [Haloactinospora alba]TQN31857.1 prolyl oligopeptidase [Haloactinospora alba]
MASAGSGTQCSHGRPTAPPTAGTQHGTSAPDPYRWLEEPDSVATREWLRQRHSEFAAAASDWPLRTALAAEIRDLVDTELWSAPEHRAGWLFATRREAGANHPRLLAIAEGRERTLFDPEVLDPSGRTTLDGWSPGPGGELVAVQSSTGGTERGELRVLSTRSGLPVEPPVRGLRYSHIAWLSDTEAPAFYYVRRDSGSGERGIWLHRVCSDEPDVLVRSCAEPGSVPGVRLLGQRWLLATESHGTGHRTDLWLADIGASGGNAAEPRWTTVHEGRDIVSDAELGTDDRLYFRTTFGAERRRICVASPHSPDTAHWREVVPESPDATLEEFTVLGAGKDTELLVTRTRLGVSDLTVHDPRDGRTRRRVTLPGAGMANGLTSAPQGRAYIHYADVTRQQTVLALGAGGYEPHPWPDSSRVPHGEPFEHRVFWCRSADGTRVPVSVFTLSSRGDPRSGRPTVLHAYGGFGRPRQFGFSATVLAWLRAGGSYAVAHVRGGGEGGRGWHVAGARRNKPRSVQDLVAAADALVAGGYCAREQLCLSGGSAGGLLVLTAATSRPDVCSAVIALAPLADMLRFERLGLGRMWTREFGTVADPQDLTALLSYSPYHRALAAGERRYPAVLINGFHGDTRTDAAHARKMCAALQRVGYGGPILLRYEHGVGHGQRSVARAVELAADAHAFAAARTGLSPDR